MDNLKSKTERTGRRTLKRNSTKHTEDASLSYGLPLAVKQLAETPLGRSPRPGSPWGCHHPLRAPGKHGRANGPALLSPSRPVSSHTAPPEAFPQLPAGRATELTQEKEQASFKKHAFTSPSPSPRRSSGCSGAEGTGTRSRHPQGKARPRARPCPGPTAERAHEATTRPGAALPGSPGAERRPGPAGRAEGVGAQGRARPRRSSVPWRGDRQKAQGRPSPTRPQPDAAPARPQPHPGRSRGPALAPPPPGPAAPASSGTGGAILARRPGAFSFRFRRCRRARGLAAGGGPARGGACFRRAAPRGADAGSGRRAEPSERSGRWRRRPGPAGGPSVHHGGQAAHPHGQREAQQEHHAARERRQDLEDGPGGEGVGRALAAGAVHLCGLRISHLPDHPEHPDGHVRGRSPGEARPRPAALP